MIQMRLELFNENHRVLLRDVDQSRFLIGSNSECHVCIPDESVANIQCLLRRDGSALFLANRSASGTQVGQETVMHELRLADGDAIRLGPVRAVVRFQTTNDSQSATRTLAEQGQEPDPFQLTFPSREERWPIDERGLTLGTADSNDIVLDDPYASGVHARVALEQGRVMLRDLQSRNGVFVDDAKVGLAEVRDGSRIRIGTTELQVERVRDEASRLSLRQKSVLAAWVGRSSVSQRVRGLISRLAQNEAPVLITGETGTGKEVTARLIHDASARCEDPFVALNCGALTPTLIESELFGHEKGAFTGATGRKVGAFEAAQGGTLFLDEIGELPEDLQPQLLRVLEMSEIRRVGSNDPVAINVRVLAATNRDLEAAIEAGRFRADLYHRLAVLGVELPALRDRAADIADLARHFVRQVLPPGEQLTLSSDALQKLETHGWGGNVRELRNVIHRAVLMRGSDVLGPDDLSFSLNSLGDLVSARSQLSSRKLADVERNAIIEELVRQRGNRTETAQALGISRSTLHRKMEDYKIELSAIVRDPHEDSDLRISSRRKRR